MTELTTFCLINLLECNYGRSFDEFVDRGWMGIHGVLRRVGGLKTKSVFYILGSCDVPRSTLVLLFARVGLFGASLG